MSAPENLEAFGFLRHAPAAVHPQRRDRFVDLRGFAVLRFFEDAFESFPSFFLRSARLALAQPGLVAWRPRAIASASAGTFSVIVDPAPMYAPEPMRIGATSVVSLPINARSPIVVGCFATPS